MKLFLIAFLSLLSTTMLWGDNPAAISIVSAARMQIGKTVGYDGSYRALAYPNGDVPMETGVCCDVIIRALRSSRNMDLQRLVHEDMKANFSEYSAFALAAYHDC